MTVLQSLVSTVNSDSNEQIQTALAEFIEKNDKATGFPTEKTPVKSDLWMALNNRIRDPKSSPEIVRLCLVSLRILSREKPVIDTVVTNELIETLLQVSRIKNAGEFPNCGNEETLEGLKVVYNLIFQSQVVQVMFIEQGILEGLTTFVRDFKKDGCSQEVQFFAMRTLFLITALCSHVRPKVRNMKGIVYVTDFLEEKSKETEPYEDGSVNVLCEALKVLYNVCHDLVPSNPVPVKSNIDEVHYGYMHRITTVVKSLLHRQAKTPEKLHELQNHCVDLLNAVPVECYEVLTPVIPEDQSITAKFESKDMSTIEVIVQFLDSRLSQAKDLRTTSSLLPPVLCILVRMVRTQRAIRKYLKDKVLPPLTKSDIVNRPEVGSSIRNKLCALLTSPVDSVTDMVANFMFVLCKENVGKMIKYTGYGNAAGLLANKGLLLGGSRTENEYSSDSDSDTEEYKEVRHLINDVEGYVQEPRPRPCEGMSDEQKEYEAMKLVEVIDRLNRQGLIQPCTISEDGRPMPVEHVLQLAEFSDRMRRRQGDSDSDDD